MPIPSSTGNGATGAGIASSRLRAATASAPGSALDLSSLLPSEWLGGVYSSGAPEVKELVFGILPLTDSAPIVVAHEKGLFAKYGISSRVEKSASWSASRNALVANQVQGAHLLFGIPVGAAIGKMGNDGKPLIVPWIMNRNGQAITLSAKHRGRFAADPKALLSLAIESRDKGRPMVFAMTLPTGTHAMWLRYWLGAGGIDPDKDVALITIPPPQMAENMRDQRVDGFCVGDPWNARVISEDLGYTAILSEQIWPDHPEKVLAFTEEFAEANPNSVKAALRAMHEASIWCDAPENRAELAALLALPAYLNTPAGIIASRLGDAVDFGDGRTAGGLRGPTFQKRNANYPQSKYAVWWLSQFRRWKMLLSPPDYLGVAGRVMRPDFYEAAMKEIGVAHGGADLTPETLFDGCAFDASEPEEYAASFKISNVRS